MPQSQSPINDQTGALCGLKQSGPVWYLAGGFGSSKITRACSVPQGQHIFFPVINMLQYTPPGEVQTCDQVKAAAAANNERFVFLRVHLNASALENAERFRIASKECFNPFERVPAEYNPPSLAPSATDGYWIMLAPLPPGTYDLTFAAFYTNQGGAYGDMVQNISYTLTVDSE